MGLFIGMVPTAIQYFIAKVSLPHVRGSGMLERTLSTEMARHLGHSHRVDYLTGHIHGTLLRQSSLMM